MDVPEWSVRRCVADECPAWFDYIANLTGEKHARGWVQTHGVLGGAHICPGHAAAVVGDPGHYPVRVARDSTGAVTCSCGEILLPERRPIDRGACVLAYGRHLADTAQEGAER